MTICISAIGTDKDKNEEFIVFSTDHMVTFGLGDLSNQFEHSIKKYKELGISKKVVAMLSGKTLLFEELLKGTERLDDYDEIREKIYQNFREIKKAEIYKQLLEPFAISDKDLKEFLLKPIDNPISKTILEGILKHNLDTSILLIGFKDKKAQVYEINEYQNISIRDIHFHTIGSGSLQASNCLFVQKHCRDNNLKETIYNVYKAKRNAEVAIGVGDETEVLVCNEKKIVALSPEDLEKLKKIYKDELEFGKRKVILEGLNSLNDLLKSTDVEIKDVK